MIEIWVPRLVSAEREAKEGGARGGGVVSRAGDSKPEVFEVGDPGEECGDAEAVLRSLSTSRTTGSAR